MGSFNNLGKELKRKITIMLLLGRNSVMITYKKNLSGTYEENTTYLPVQGYDLRKPQIY